MVEISEFFFIFFQTSVIQDPTVTSIQKWFFFLKFSTYTRNGSFGVFWVET